MQKVWCQKLISGVIWKDTSSTSNIVYSSFVQIELITRIAILCIISVTLTFDKQKRIDNAWMGVRVNFINFPLHCYQMLSSLVNIIKWMPWYLWKNYSEFIYHLEKKLFCNSAHRINHNITPLPSRIHICVNIFL